MLRGVILLLLATPLGFAAPVPKELKRNDDERAILGTWQMVKQYRDGVDAGPQPLLWRFKVDGTAMIVNTDDRTANLEVAYKLDPAGKSSGFDWIWPGSTYLGLYRLDGDKLTVVFACRDKDRQPRPTELKAVVGVYYSEFRRVKPEGK